MKIAALLLLLMGFCSIKTTLHAQEITVIDKVTQQRVPGAKIYSINPKIQKLANINGRFQLDWFKGCDSVYISYTDFSTRAFTYLELSKLTWVELSDKPLTISEMIVTANRWEQDLIKVPNRITKLDIREVDLLAPQTSADLLESSGYVFVQKSQLAGGSPELRGFGTNRVMIVVDGVRMNNAIFRSGNLQNIISLDGNSLESAEVLFGPGAVMYGSDAIGGVMDFRTKKATFSPDSLKSHVRSNVFSRYSSSSNEFTSHLDLNIGKEKWAFLTAATYSIFGDMTVGKYGNNSFLRPSYQETINGVDSTLVNPNPRIQVNSGYNQLNFIQKIQFQPSERWYFDYAFNYSTLSDAPRYDRLTLDGNGDGNLDYIEWYYGPQNWMMNKFSFVNTPQRPSIYNQLRFTAAYQNFKESRHDRKMGSSSIRRQYERVDAFSINMDFEKEMGTRVSFYYGLEGVLNKIRSSAFREPIDGGDQLAINSRYPDGSIWQTYGAYANINFRISEKWVFNTGIRYTYYQINADFDTSLFTFPVTSTTNSNGSLNGNLGLVYNPSERTQVYFNVSSGFRAPNIDDLGKVFDSEPGSVIVPNVDLKPEYAYNGELGFVKSIKNWLKIDGVGYFTYLKDAMVRANYTFEGQDSMLYEGSLSQVQAVQNSSNAYVYGVQGGLEIVFGKGLSLKSTISYQKGQEYNVDSAQYFPKSHVSPLFGRTTLKYKRRHMVLNFYAVYHARVDIEEFPLNERGAFIYAKDENGFNYSPSWYTLNFKGSYFFNKHLSLSAGVENITNQLYRTFGSGISASGTNFIVSLKATF